MTSSRGAAFEPIRVLIVDDHPVVRDSLSRLIEAEADMTVVGVAGTADETYSAFRKFNPDIVILDIALADAHGLDLLQNLLAEDPDPGAVVFSMYDERTYAERAIRAGARGYVMKSAPTRSILDAIRTTHRGDYYLSPPVLSRILRSLSKSDVAAQDRPFANLTDRELEVYQLLGQGLDLPAIARQLSLGRKTVETYRRRIKEKLELDSMNELLQHAIQWTHAQSRQR
jgi:DNA-binding NarL/FixJ family response regulator